MLHLTIKYDGQIEQALRNLRKTGLIAAMQRSVNQAIVPARKHFNAEFRKQHPGYIRKGAVAPAQRAKYRAGLNYLRPPAYFAAQPPAVPYFTRMLKGGVETAKSPDGMIVALPQYKVRKGQGRRKLRGSKIDYYDTKVGGKPKDLWRSRPRADRDEYVGPFKMGVVNPRNMNPLNKAQLFAVRLARIKIHDNLLREIRGAIVARGLGFRRARR